MSWRIAVLPVHEKFAALADASIQPADTDEDIQRIIDEAVPSFTVLIEPQSFATLDRIRRLNDRKKAIYVAVCAPGQWQVEQEWLDGTQEEG